MDQQALEAALGAGLPQELARDLAVDFVQIRSDVATGTLGRAAPGKFVETVVQSLQSLENKGNYDKKPDVDEYLRKLESRSSQLGDGFRICASRVARAMYSLRNKRNIAHKGDVDASAYDLHFLYSGAQWILAELLADISDITGTEAARRISEVQMPVSDLVEVIEDRVIVHADMTVREEALVVLMTHCPTPVSAAEVIKSMNRRAARSVSNALAKLWRERYVERNEDNLLVLTAPGLREAIQIAGAYAK